MEIGLFNPVRNDSGFNPVRNAGGHRSRLAARRVPLAGVRPVSGAASDDRAATAGSHLTARLLARAMSDGPEATDAAGHRYSLYACNPPQPTETRARTLRRVAQATLLEQIAEGCSGAPPCRRRVRTGPPTGQLRGVNGIVCYRAAKSRSWHQWPKHFAAR
jgi:hypothetical protein